MGSSHCEHVAHCTYTIGGFATHIFYIRLAIQNDTETFGT